MHHHGACPNFRPVSDGDSSYDHGVAANFHIITDHWHVIRTPAVANGCAMTEGAIFSEHCLFVHHEGRAMIKPQAGPDGGFVAEFDSEFPDNDEMVSREVRPPQPAES